MDNLNASVYDMAQLNHKTPTNNSGFHPGWANFCQFPNSMPEFRNFCASFIAQDKQEYEVPWSLTEPEVTVGHQFYIYIIPIILLVGITGNIISLFVFSQPGMKSSATCYLTVLCFSDLIMLLTFVGVKYLDLGLPYVTGSTYKSVIAISGLCQLYVYVVHVARAVSAWIIVVFSVERYVAVCMPLQSRVFCRHTLSIRCLLGITSISALICLYKPLLSSVQGEGEYAMCTDNEDMLTEVYVLDVIYGNLVTLVPFLIITVVNIGILQALLKPQGQDIILRTSRTHKLRREFTLILLSVSLCFLCFNIPYYIVWMVDSDIYRQHTTQQEINDFFISPDNSTIGSDGLNGNGRLFFTRTVFSVNYCTNFLLYCITGSCYRASVRQLWRCGKEDRNYRNGDCTLTAQLTNV